MSVLCKTGGFQIGTVCVPSFTLHRGEWILLRWPVNCGSDSEEKFYGAISGRAVCSGLELHSAAWIVTAFGKWAESLYGSRTVGEVVEMLPPEDRELFQSEIESARQSLSAPAHHLPGTARMLAALMLACSSSEVLVFNTAGLDPMGVRKVYAFLVENLKERLGLIELEFPGVAQAQAHPARVTILQASQRGQSGSG